jgi:hypothetical protein
MIVSLLKFLSRIQVLSQVGADLRQDTDCSALPQRATIRPLSKRAICVPRATSC